MKCHLDLAYAEQKNLRVDLLFYISKGTLILFIIANFLLSLKKILDPFLRMTNFENPDFSSKFNITLRFL